MHLFLTGPSQTGKSTALRRFLETTKLPADGFLTAFDAQGEDRRLFFIRFDTQAPESGERRLAARAQGRLTRIYSGVFDGFGADCLRAAGQRRLILMDELGTMEEGSPRFIAEVFHRLDGAVPVAGVVKMQASPFLDAVRAHPRVRLVLASRDNRDVLPDLLAGHFADFL
ncbi:MAG: nucleoside-triphosphatase [Treponema sp.]|jgi:nucleoside-triphosphatase THEP1|nr:nucleoside-triphosphatase [Treponema sp.]